MDKFPTGNCCDMIIEMNLLKLLITILILCTGIAYAQSDLDNYYTLEQEVAKLRAQFRDNQGLISEHNTTSNHFWSPSSTKKILDRLHKDQDRILKEMKPKVEEMRRLEQSLEVKAWTYRFATLEQVSTTLGDVASNNTCSAQVQQLFTSDKAFEAWNAQNGDLDRRVAYYAEKNGYISRCLERKRERDRVKVDENWFSLCKKVNGLPDKRYRSKKAYKLEVKNGQIILAAKLYFSFKGDETDKEKAFKRMRKARPCMENFFARHGIKLELTFQEESGWYDWWNCDHSLELRTDALRAKTANATRWFSHKLDGNNLSDSQVCSLNMHEFSHLLGLPDLYSDPVCPDGLTGPRDSLMNGAWGDIETLKLYPNEIEQVLQPLCEI